MTYKVLRSKKKKTKITKALAPAARKEVAKIAKNVSLRQGELKYFDTTQTLQYLDQTFTVLNVSNIATQGSGDAANRIGDEVVQRSIQINISVKAATVTSNTVHRIMLIRYVAEGDPAANDILSNEADGYAPISVLHHDNRRLFNVLWDTGPVGLSNASGGLQFRTYMKTIGLKNYKQRFDAGGSSNVKGALYLLFGSDVAAVSDNTAKPSFLLRARYKYLDP